MGVVKEYPFTSFYASGVKFTTTDTIPLLSQPLSKSFFLRFKSLSTKQVSLNESILEWVNGIIKLHKTNISLIKDSELPSYGDNRELPSLFELYAPKHLKHIINKGHEFLFSLYTAKGIQQNILATDFHKPISSILNEQLFLEDEQSHRSACIEGACVAFPFTILSLFLYRHFHMRIKIPELFKEEILRYKTQLFLQEYLYHFGAFADVSVTVQDHIHLWFSSYNKENVFYQSLKSIMLFMQEL